MDTVPAPVPASAALTTSAGRGDDEEIPLGCECANPALQIACWGTDEARAAAAGLVSES